MNKSPAGRALTAIAASSLLLLSACGDDEDSESSATDAPSAITEAAAETTAAPAATTAAPVETAEAPAAPAATTAAPAGDACDAWIAADGAIIGYLFAGQGDAASVNAAIDTAIESSTDEAQTATLTELKTEAQPQLEDTESEPSDRLLELYRGSISWAGENCDVETVDVTATDYHYDGIPTELSTGYHVVNFANEGTEMHEMLAIRINDGVTESVEELVALPEEEVMTKITMINASFAPPGASDVGSWNLTEPGNYAVLCFVPVGSVGEAEGEGPPHFTQGMIHEFTVS